VSRSFPFDESFDPPALTIDEVGHPVSLDSTRRRGKIDPGADGGLIPLRVAEELDLEKVAEVDATDFTGRGKRQLPVYYVHLKVADSSLPTS